MTKPDTYEDYREWHDPRPDSTAGDAMREFTATPLSKLGEWWARDKADRATEREAG